MVKSVLYADDQAADNLTPKAGVQNQKRESFCLAAQQRVVVVVVILVLATSGQQSWFMLQRRPFVK